MCSQMMEHSQGLPDLMDFQAMLEVSDIKTYVTDRAIVFLFHGQLLRDKI